MSFLGDIVKKVAGPVLGGGIGLIGNAQTNSNAKDAAQAANAFTERQLKNRHQWEVADLKAAGLNPILSAHGTPSIGGSAKADVANVGEDISKGVSSALAVKRVAAEIDLLREQAKKASAETTAVNLTNTSRGVLSDVWEKFLGPAAERGIGSARALENMVSQAARLGKAHIQSVPSAVKKRFVRDAQGNDYNYPERK